MHILVRESKYSDKVGLNICVIIRTFYNSKKNYSINQIMFWFEKGVVVLLKDQT